MTPEPTTTPAPRVASDADNDALPIDLPPMRLIGPTLAAFGGALVVAALVIVLIGDPAWWRGLLAAGVSVLISMLLTLPLTLWVLHQPARLAALVLAMSGGVRLIVAVVGCLVAIKAGQYPPIATLACLLPLYLAVLAAESLVLHGALWKGLRPSI